MRKILLATFLGLLAALPAYAQSGRYTLEGVGPEGAYQGTAVVAPSGNRHKVALRTFDASGQERRAEATARLRKDRLRFTCKATRDGVSETALRAHVRPLAGDPGSLIATYKDSRGKVIRRECWLPTDTVRVPVQVVGLRGGEGFHGVTAAQARVAQRALVAQLTRAFRSAGLSFAPITPEPRLVDGARYDADDDGKLSTAESRSLRDALEIAGLKRRGRVVVVLTAAEFAHGHGQCRGWTLGDAPATPLTLTDLNDNFSLVGIDYVDGRRFHTVAHEVAHQLGLDDLNVRNREELHAPRRADHLMISGGDGFHLDRQVVRLLRNARQFPDHGLEGRLGTPVTSSLNGLSMPASAPRDGLPAPVFSR